jgi:hypothetical protein
MGSQAEQFIRLPDGSYNAQLGSTERLNLNAGNYQLQFKDGTTLSFNAAGYISTWQSPAGVTVSFTYTSSLPTLLSSVTNGVGQTLTLNYK